jgi:hypothetical protein
MMEEPNAAINDNLSERQDSAAMKCVTFGSPLN